MKQANCKRDLKYLVQGPGSVRPGRKRPYALARISALTPGGGGTVFAFCQGARGLTRSEHGASERGRGLWSHQNPFSEPVLGARSASSLTPTVCVALEHL